MKILHVIDSAGLYGAEMMVLNLCVEQARLGREPIIASIGVPHSADKPLETEARRRGVRVVPFRMMPGPNVPGALRILRFVRNEGVRVLHSHGYKGNILFGLIPEKIRKVPLIATIHGWTGTGEFNRMMFYEWLDSLALNFIDHVVLVNEVMKDHPKFRCRSRVRSHVVPNGIPVDGNSPASDDVATLDSSIVDFCGKGYTVGAIGRLSREKGFDQLVEAVALLVNNGLDIRLVILGEGTLRSELEKRVRDLGIQSRVLLPGYVGNARDYLKLFNVFVLSSVTEGLPIVILEAMLAGVPIVSTRVGGVPEVLQDGKAGILVAAPCARDLADGISEMANDNKKAVIMANLSNRIVRKKYSAVKMAKKYDELYRTIQKYKH